MRERFAPVPWHGCRWERHHRQQSRGRPWQRGWRWLPGSTMGRRGRCRRRTGPQCRPRRSWRRPSRCRWNRGCWGNENETVLGILDRTKAYLKRPTAAAAPKPWDWEEAAGGDLEMKREVPYVSPIAPWMVLLKTSSSISFQLGRVSDGCYK